MTRLRMPSTTREPIKCFSKVLDGTLAACGLGINRGPNVVFKVSSNIAIISLVLSFKSWKLNNSVLTSFYAASRIWSWHSISWLVENYVFSSCTCTLGTQEFDALATCGIIVSSPFANKVCFSFVLKGRRDYGMTIQAPLALIIGLEPNASLLIWITCLVAKIMGATLASCAIK